MQEVSMRIMILGVSGLIGSAISARLVMDGHHVLGISRRRFNPGLMPIKHVSIDIARAKCSEDWLSLLSNIDVVVNCAGALQDAPGESLSGVHTTGLAALF